MKRTHHALEAIKITVWLIDNRPGWKQITRLDDSTEIRSGDRTIIKAPTPQVLEYLQKLQKGEKQDAAT